MRRIASAIFAITAGGLLGAGAAPTTPAPIDPATVTIRIEPLGNGVAALFGSGGNIGVSHGIDGVVLVDDQYAPLTPKITEALRGLNERPVRFVVNTHWHFDHSGGNENFGKAGAVIVAHDNVRTRMSKEGFIQALNMQFPPSPKEALPVVTFAEGITFHLNGDTLRVVHVVPAHTDGDSMIKWETANVLHTGDVFTRTGTPPFADRSSGGSPAGMIAAMETAIALADDNTKVIPGHGPMSTRAQMVAHLDAVRGMIQKVTAEQKAGKSLEQILALKLPWPLATAAPAANAPFPTDRFVTAIHEELTMQKR